MQEIHKSVLDFLDYLYVSELLMTTPLSPEDMAVAVCDVFAFDRSNQPSWMKIMIALVIDIHKED